MPASAKQPTAVLIVHGAYFLPPAWAPFINDLKAEGFVVACPRLPTCGDTRPPTAQLKDDAAAVKKAATELMNEGHSFLVLAHSYGGIVACEAISPDLYLPQDGAGGKGGATKLVFLSAWLLQPDTTLMDAFHEYGFQSQVDIGRNEDGTVWAKNAPESFFNDIEPSKAATLAANNVTHNGSILMEKVGAAPWKDLPTTYIFCLQDKAIEVPLQKSMVEDARVVGCSASFVTEEMDSAHCPFLSKPGELIALVRKIAGE